MSPGQNHPDTGHVTVHSSKPYLISLQNVVHSNDECSPVTCKPAASKNAELNLNASLLAKSILGHLQYLLFENCHQVQRL